MLWGWHTMTTLTPEDAAILRRLPLHVRCGLVSADVTDLFFGIYVRRSGRSFVEVVCIGEGMRQAAERRQQQAYRALVSFHARELLGIEKFRRTGRLWPEYVSRIARDLAEVDPSMPLDRAVTDILARADALELELEVAS